MHDLSPEFTTCSVRAEWGLMYSQPHKSRPQHSNRCLHSICWEITWISQMRKLGSWEGKGLSWEDTAGQGPSCCQNLCTCPFCPIWSLLLPVMKSLWTVTATMKLKDACSLESHDKPRQRTKKQRHHFVDKGLYSESYYFSSSHVQMWELDHKEGWTPNNWCFQIVNCAEEDSWESLGQQGDQISQS